MLTHHCYIQETNNKLTTATTKLHIPNCPIANWCNNCQYLLPEW